ncbi:MAG: hypothetical protein M3R04_05610, partial [bacterium]|nr:hypothetical protein [bacterium]
ISGDTHTGSVNRIGAGLDYNLTSGRHPLTLMANAVLDVYNFRQPTFNTSRITSFDVGLRYGLTENLYTTLGWMTYNDSENDSTGSGIFAGLQWLSDSSENCDISAPALPPGDFIVEPDPATVVPPVAPLETPPAPIVEQQSVAVVETPVEATVEPPVPTEVAEQPTVTTLDESPPPATETIVLPDGRAELPARQRVVSALHDEFSSAPIESETTLDDCGIEDYDPRSWADIGELAEEATFAEDPGVAVPALDLFPESVQANAGDVRPAVNRGRSTSRSASSASDEKPLPADDQTVVEVEIVADPPAQDGG